MDSKIGQEIKGRLWFTCAGLGLSDKERRKICADIDEVIMGYIDTDLMQKGGETTEAYWDRVKKRISGSKDGPQTFQQAFDTVAKELKDLMVAKQRDYGKSNVLSAGEIGVMVRANDKMARLMNLNGFSDGKMIRKEVANESLEDSWKDLANYAIIALMLRRGIFTLPLDQYKP